MSFEQIPPFGRVVTAMITPFNDDGEIDLNVAAKLAKYLSINGSDGIVVCGTTGESPTLSWHEQIDLLKTVKQSVGNTTKVLAGTGSNSTAEAVEATKTAYEAGADGALVVAPYYNKPPQEGLIRHFEKIANSAPDLPIMLYNIPGRTGCSIDPKTVRTLIKSPNIICIKAASGTTEEVTNLRLLCGSDLSIYCGDDALLLPMMSVGASGVVSVASHLVGPNIKKLIEKFISGDVCSALRYHESLQPLFKALFSTTNPIPVKAALQIQGWKVGNPRSPLVPLNHQMKQELSSVLKNLGIS